MLSPAKSSAKLGPYANAGAPSAGTSEVQTLTFSGTISTLSFKLKSGARRTAAIAWSATNSTLVSNIDTALEAIFGTGTVTTAVGTMTAGIGTITVTFAGTQSVKPIGLLEIVEKTATGTTPDVTIALTTPGVSATARGAAKGALLIDTTNGLLYINTGTSTAPTWTKVGTQT